MLKRQERREKIDQGMGILGDERFGKLFEDEDFTVDEKSREFQMLNPSTKVNSQDVIREPKGSGSEIDSDVSDELDGVMSKPLPKPEMRISSSSYRKSGHQRKDKALGSRVKGLGKVEKGRAEIVGERRTTFTPKSTKMSDEKQPARNIRREDGRRSASGNVFRRL